MYVRAYLRASTYEQDAPRACEKLEAFCAERTLSIAAKYIENESGAKSRGRSFFDCSMIAAPATYF